MNKNYLFSSNLYRHFYAVMLNKKDTSMYKDKHVLFVSVLSFFLPLYKCFFHVYYVICYGNHVNLNINTTITDENLQSGNRDILQITTVWK